MIWESEDFATVVETLWGQVGEEFLPLLNKVVLERYALEVGFDKLDWKDLKLVEVDLAFER